MKKITLFAFLLGWALSSYGQGAAVEFGKNRVQYHDFDWWKYESERFITYWYQGGQNVGQAAVLLAEQDYNEVRTILEYRINDKIELLVYNDLTDLKQSNIGSDEIFMNTTGVTKIIGNKIFVYFDGNHLNLRKQIREGVAQVLLSNMMFGANFQEVLQNAVLLNLPEWFTNGLVAYIGDNIAPQNGWNTTADNRLRDLLQSEKVRSFEDLLMTDAHLAGQSFWYFIAQNYGKSTVSNLLYLTRINKSMETGFLYVLGSNYGETMVAWQRFYSNRYTKTTVRDTWDESSVIAYKNKKQLPITQLKISPNGKFIAYCENEIGKYKVFLQNIKTGERRVILKDGSRNPFQQTDYNYPLLAWTATGLNLTVAFEERDVLKMMVYDVDSKKSETYELPAKYERLQSMDFFDGRQMVFSAVQDGYSDIFLYDIQTKNDKRITQDFYDDLDPVFVKIGNRKGIAFSSNRTDSLLQKVRLDSILPISDFNIWYFDLETKDPAELVRVTHTPLVQERQPMAIDERYFSFLSDKNGITNRHTAYIDTVFAYNERVYILDGSREEIILHADSLLDVPAEIVDTTFLRAIFKPKGFSYANTDFSHDIVAQHSSTRTGEAVHLVRRNDAYVFYKSSLAPNRQVISQATVFAQQVERARREKLEKEKTLAKAKKEQQQQVLNPKTDNPFQNVPKDTLPPTPNEPTPQKNTPPKDTVQKIDIDNYFFQSEFEDKKQPQKPTEVVTNNGNNGNGTAKPAKILAPTLIETPRLHDFKRSRILPYQLKFRSNFVSTTLDNSLLFDGRVPFSGSTAQYNYPSPGILLMADIDDIFEDYRLQAGVRVPTVFNGAEYFLMFSDLSKRLDKRYAVYRRTIRESETRALTGRLTPSQTSPSTYTYDDTNIKTVSNLAEARFKYPLDVFTSLRATATFRNDQQHFLANNFLTLDQASQQEQRVGAKLEYVFDNTIDVRMNIKNGTRYKVFGEVQKRFSVELSETEGLKTDFEGGWLGILGLDARHYQRLDRHSIFAARLSAATSFGDEKMLYFLGGTDNWLLPQYEENIPVNNADTYAYQTLATNLRGFRGNIRNGNSFVAANFEVRVPIFSYLSQRPIKSVFMKNFQVVGFLDVGTAWSGLSPFSTDNPLNTIIIQNPNSPITVKVNYFRNPIVTGTGLGVRSTIFGYFVRLDYARGIETGVIQDARWYLSLGTDF